MLETGGVTQTRNASTTTLVVNTSNVDSFQNRDLYSKTTCDQDHTGAAINNV